MRLATRAVEKLVQPHGGDPATIAAQLGLEADLLIDFSASLNPYGPPVCVTDALTRQPAIERYPEPDAWTLIEAIAARDKIDPLSILAGNGSAEILYWFCAWVKPANVVIAEPGFADYRLAAAANGATVTAITLNDVDGFPLDFRLLDKTAAVADLVVLGRPNNPTGTMTDKRRLLECVAAHRSAKFLIDEAFIDFVEDEPSLVADVSEHRNLFVLRSMTKIYTMPGLRLGYLVGHQGEIAPMRAGRPPWPLSQSQIEAGRVALSDTDFTSDSRERLGEERRLFMAELGRVREIEVFDSKANFFLIKVSTPGSSSTDLTIALAKAGILVRDCASFDTLGDRFIRLAVRTRDQNNKLVETLSKILRGAQNDMEAASC